MVTTSCCEGIFRHQAGSILRAAEMTLRAAKRPTSCLHAKLRNGRRPVSCASKATSRLLQIPVVIVLHCADLPPLHRRGLAAACGLCSTTVAVWLFAGYH